MSISPVVPCPPLRWCKGPTVGSGASSTLSTAINLDTGERFAIKEVSGRKSANYSGKPQDSAGETEEESNIHEKLEHPNISRCLGTQWRDGTYYVFLDFALGETLTSNMEKFGAFPESVIQVFTKQLLLALQYLHNKGIIHMDVKGLNILIGKRGIMLAYFGSSKEVSGPNIEASMSMSMPNWMAPEVVQKGEHNMSVDIWSVGCTVIEMATGYLPWGSLVKQEIVFYLRKGRSPPLPNNLSPAAQDFLEQCLQRDPLLRPTATQLLQHPFITG